MTGLDGVGLRTAARDDLEAIVEVVLASAATFASWAPPSWRPSPREYERAHWWGRLPGDRARRTRVAATGGDGIVGVASWGQATHLSGNLAAIPGVAHLAALFVAPSWWLRGIGSALLRDAEAGMRRAGYERAELWTPADGPARGFYEARGWIADGRLEWSPALGLTVAGYERELARGAA